MAHVLAALLAAQDATGMRDLIEAWRSDYADVRDKATADVLARWREWKADDLRRLEEAVEAEDVEVASRARAALSRLGVRRKLGARVLDKLPTAEAAFTIGTERERLSVLRDAGELTSTDVLSAADVAPLVELAAAGAWKERAHDVVDAANWYEALEPLLTAMFRHPDPRVREDAVRNVWRRQQEAVVRAAVPLLEDSEPAVRQAAVESLGLLDRFNFADRFAVRLADRAPDVRLKAIDALGRLGGARHADALAALLNDGNSSVRAQAAIALARAGQRAWGGRIVPLLRDPDSQVRAVAAEALCHADAREHAGAVAPLLRDANFQVRKQALDALGDLGAVEFAPDIASLASDPDRDIRIAVVWALQRLGVREHAPVVRRMLDQPDMRCPATVWALAWLDGGPHRELFVGYLKSPDPNLRRAGAEALGLARDKASAVLIAPLLEDDNGLVREQAAAALRRLGRRDGAERLRAQLQHRDDRRRTDAIAAIVTLDAGAMGPLIEPLLRDDSGDVRARAVRALGLLRSRDSAGALARLLDDADVEPRAAALLALARVGADDVERSCAGWESRREWPLRAASGIALTLRGRADRVRQRALLAELETRWINDEAPYADELFEALEAHHEPAAREKLGREVVLAAPVASLDELKAVVLKAGLRLVVDDERNVRVWGRLPEGWSGTVNELLVEVQRGYAVRNVAEGDEVRLLTDRQTLVRWIERLGRAK